MGKLISLCFTAGIELKQEKFGDWSIRVLEAKDILPFPTQPPVASSSKNAHSAVYTSKGKSCRVGTPTGHLLNWKG